MEGNQAEPCRRHSLRLPGAAPPYPPSSPALPLAAVAAFASAAALPCCLQTVVKCAFSRTRTSQGGIFSPCPLVLPPSLPLSLLPPFLAFLPPLPCDPRNSPAIPRPSLPSSLTPLPDSPDRAPRPRLSRASNHLPHSHHIRSCRPLLRESYPDFEGLLLRPARHCVRV